MRKKLDEDDKRRLTTQQKSDPLRSFGEGQIALSD